jgi:hypothetical protein
VQQLKSITRRHLARIGLIGTVSALAVGVPTPAAVAGISPAVADCNAHGQLTRHYTLVELRAALNTMPTDVKEYTDCYDVIQHQLSAQLSGARPASSGSTSVGGPSGSFLPTPVIAVLVVLALGAVGFGIVAVRRRR